MTETVGEDEADAPPAFSAVECQQCGTITKIDVNQLPTRCGFCGAGKEDLVEL